MLAKMTSQKSFRHDSPPGLDQVPLLVPPGVCLPQRCGQIERTQGRVTVMGLSLPVTSLSSLIHSALFAVFLPFLLGFTELGSLLPSSLNLANSSLCFKTFETYTKYDSLVEAFLAPAWPDQSSTGCVPP